MADADAPFHAHVYYEAGQRPAAERLRDDLARRLGNALLFVGRMTDKGIGPHPIPQFEIHFRESALARVVAEIRTSGLKALVHPLTDDDLADHSELAQWIGEKLELDFEVLDPPGHNQGMARFGKSDF